jgi:hypothetical protein
MGDIMQIHLSKPGGQREGPFTLEQIIKDLAANKYSDTDYWAWHEGMTEWVPLYLLPGIAADADSAPAAAEPPQSSEMTVPSQADAAPSDTAMASVSPVPVPAKPGPPPRVTPVSSASAAPAVATPETHKAAPPTKRQALPPEPSPAQVPAPAASPVTEPEEEPAGLSHQVSSDMPASALDQIFMFTSGDGPSAWQSPTVVRMLQEIIGEDLSALREDIPRDVVARCAVGELLKPDGSISDAVWRAMAAHRPTIVRQAKDRLYRVCVRTFRIEAGEIVAVVLFYNKQKF